MSIANSLVQPRFTRRSDLPWLNLGLALGLSATGTMAEGFRSSTLGAQALGTTGGKFAFIDDASAVIHNPANLTELDQWEASFEPTIIHHQADFRNGAGATASTRSPWKFLPNAFFGGPIKNTKFAAGLGISVPYGLSVEWNPNGPLRYAASHFVELQTINVNPTIAWKPCQHFTLGASVNVMWSQLQFRQFYPWALVDPSLTDGLLSAKGDDTSLGGSLAATWHLNENHRLALTVRSPMDADFEGDFQATGVPTVPGGILQTPFKSEIDFPTIIGLGYGWQCTPTLRLAADAEWIQFSRFKSLPIQVPVPLPPGIADSIPQNWRDTFTFGASAAWEFKPHWTLRGSYQHFQTPVPDRTYSPTIPDASQNALAVGIGFRSGHHRIDAAYSHVFYDTRNITGNQNPALNGRYEVTAHLLSVAYGYRF